MKDCLVNFFSLRIVPDTFGYSSFVYAKQLGQGCEVSTWGKVLNSHCQLYGQVCILFGSAAVALSNLSLWRHSRGILVTGNRSKATVDISGYKTCPNRTTALFLDHESAKDTAVHHLTAHNIHHINPAESFDLIISQQVKNKMCQRCEISFVSAHHTVWHCHYRMSLWNTDVSAIWAWLLQNFLNLMGSQVIIIMIILMHVGLDDAAGNAIQ